MYKEHQRLNDTMDYPAAARSISLNLDEFCNRQLNYPYMITVAAREARNEIQRLRKKLETIQEMCKK